MILSKPTLNVLWAERGIFQHDEHRSIILWIDRRTLYHVEVQQLEGIRRRRHLGSQLDADDGEGGASSRVLESISAMLARIYTLIR